jgi:hypothetical protein
MVCSVVDKHLLSNRHLNKINYECGLGSNFNKEKFFNITLNAFNFKYMDGIINNKCNLIMLNSASGGNFINVDNLIKYLNKDQLQYLHFDPLEYQELTENPLVKIGFNGVKGIITPEVMYNYGKYGIKGLSSNFLFNSDFFIDDIGIGDL